MSHEMSLLCVNYKLALGVYSAVNMDIFSQMLRLWKQVEYPKS